MPQVETRIFEVHLHDEDRCHARHFPAPAFEVAAVAYLETCGPPAGGPDVRVIVRDMATGHEHCFAIDLDTGETASCD